MSPAHLDAIDEEIIRQLQSDGRRPYTQLAKVVGLSEAAVRQRVQRLLEAGVMQVVAVTDPLSLGLRRQAMVGIKVQGDVRHVADVLAKLDEVVYVVLTAGSVDLLAEVVVASDDDLLHLLNDSIRSIPGVVATDTSIYLSLRKQTYQWGHPMSTSQPRSTEHLEDLASRHLWMHFSRMGPVAAGEPVPIIDRGDGCWLWDHAGKRYLDALSGLFVVNAGHGRQELADVGAQQGGQLSYFPLWSYAHPPAIELAARLAELAPGDLNRVFFTVSGSEAVESAWKLARQYFRLLGQPGRYKVISRQTAYHGTTLGALAITAVPAMRVPFEPLAPGGVKVPNTNTYRPWIEGIAPEDFGRITADQVARAIEMEGPETVCAVFVEPVQNAGGSIPPPPGYMERLREICDHYGVLLVSDEVICAYGRLGTMFGCEAVGVQPDMITSAKGLTSGYSPLGAVLVSDRIFEPFSTDTASFAHGITFGGHPVSCAIALANLDIFEKEDLCGNVQANAPEFEAMLNRVKDDCPIVGDVRGLGYFWAMELVKDQATRAEFSRAECEDLIRGFLSPRLYDEGLICRADDRGDPVIQFAPPLIAGPEELAELERILRKVLTEASNRLAA